eukprot:403355089
MEAKNIQASSYLNIRDSLQKLAGYANQKLSNDIYAKLDQGNGLECEELKDITSSEAQFFKVQVNDETYFVKKIPFSDIVLKKILTQYEIQQKFGCEMIAQILTIYYQNNHIHLVFEYTEYGDLFTYSQNHRISDQEMRLILQQIFTLLSVMHLSSYYHNDLKASNYLIIETFPSIRIKLCDFETLSTVERSESQKMTVEHLYKQEIGKDIFFKSQQDVKNIIESIQSICKEQRKKFGIKKVDNIIEETKQNQRQTISEILDQIDLDNFDGESPFKQKRFTGGGVVSDPSDPLKIPDGECYHKDLYELIQNVLGLHNDKFSCAFQILTDKYLLNSQTLKDYLQNIMNDQVNLDVMYKLQMYNDYQILTNPTVVEFTPQDKDGIRLELNRVMQQLEGWISIPVEDPHLLKLINEGYYEKQDSSITITEKQPGPRKLINGGYFEMKDLGKGDNSDNEEHLEKDE